MSLDHRAVLPRSFAAIIVIVLAAACSRPAPPQVAVTPAARPKHSQAWEDSVVLSAMAADRRAADSAKAAARRALASEQDALGKMTFFSFDQAVLSDDDRATLDAKVPVLLANPEIQVQIAGNCDDRGSEEYNLALGQRRAAAAKRYLLDRGILESRITIISYGLEKPVAKGEDERAWAMNRNDQFVIIRGQLHASTGTD